MRSRFLRVACGVVFLVASATLARIAVADDLKPAAANSNTAESTTPSQNTAAPADTNSVASKPAAGQRSAPRLTEDRFKDWSLQCVVNSPATPPCQVMYELTSADHKQVALVLSLAIYPKDSARLQMALPLGFSIPQGVQVAFGKDYSLTAQVSRCTIQGCLVEGQGQAKMIEAMLKAKDGSATVYNMQGAKIRLPISLDGFSAAYDMLKKKS